MQFINLSSRWIFVIGSNFDANVFQYSVRTARIHDLKHTFGRRLRAAGVSFEDRQDLLGHKSGRITTHYSAAELQNLIEAANRVCEQKSRNGSTAQSLAVQKPLQQADSKGLFGSYGWT